MLDLVRVLH